MKYIRLVLSVTTLAAWFTVFEIDKAWSADQKTNRERLTGRTTPNSADEIRSAIMLDLRESERWTSEQPRVEVAKGVVRLSGTVASLQEKTLAAEIAKRTGGVQAVQNQILVERSDRADQAIQEDVQKVLRINSSVDEPRITVNVSNGKVALLGKVESLAEKRIAEFSASGVSGVTEVVNQITVQMVADRTDEELRDEIAALIVQSVSFDDLQIDVDVRDMVAFLSGKATSLAQKERLEAYAEIQGVDAVDATNIEVNPDAGDPGHRQTLYQNASDETISESLARSFRLDPFLVSRIEQIELDVSDGIVTLQGTVDQLRMKNRAQRLAADVVGVRLVRNNLEVSPADSELTDMEMIHTTQAAIARSAYLDRRDLRVHCQDAHITLYGVVESELEKEVAQFVASATPGVVHVNNSLVVDRKPSGKSDEAIAESLERKLKYALLGQSDEIDFTIENGVAILRGEVETWRQWQAAMDLAIEAGAHHPHNLIKVRFHPSHSHHHYFVPR